MSRSPIAVLASASVFWTSSTMWRSFTSAMTRLASSTSARERSRSSRIETRFSCTSTSTWLESRAIEPVVVTRNVSASSIVFASFALFSPKKVSMDPESRSILVTMSVSADCLKGIVLPSFRSSALSPRMSSTNWIPVIPWAVSCALVSILTGVSSLSASVILTLGGFESSRSIFSTLPLSTPRYLTVELGESPATEDSV